MKKRNRWPKCFFEGPTSFVKRMEAEKQSARDERKQQAEVLRRKLARDIERLKSGTLTGYRLSPKQKAEIRERVQSGRHPLKGSGIWIDV